MMKTRFNLADSKDVLLLFDLYTIGGADQYIMRQALVEVLAHRDLLYLESLDQENQGGKLNEF